MRSRSFWLVMLVVLISFLLRIWQIEKIPSILNRDEAAIAYNGLLLNQTGRDEWGESWPVALQSFGDYKLPGYPFLLSLVFKVLPTEDWVVRLPSVIAGSLLPLLIYLLARKLQLSQTFSLLAAVLVATMPVFFFFSRIAFEANVALSLLLITIVLLIRKNISWHIDPVVILLLVLSSFFYNTPLLIMPFLAVWLALLRGIKEVKRWLPTAILILVAFISIWLVLAPLTGQKSGITIFSDETIVTSYPEFRSQFAEILQPLLGNKGVYYSGLAVTRLLLSFGPEFLVIQGGSHPWHSIPGWGNINIILYILFLFSIFFFFTIFIKLLFANRSKLLLLTRNILQPWIDSRFGRLMLVLYLMIVSLLPSVVTTDAPHTTRSLLFLALIPLFVAMTLSHVLDALSARLIWPKQSVTVFAVCIISVLSIMLFGRYLYAYFTKYSQEQTIIFASGFEEVIRDVQEKGADQKVAVVDPSGYQYILLSWYLKIPAEQFFTTVIKQAPDRIGFRYGEQVAQYHFISQSSDRDEQETVLVEWKDNQWQVTDY